VENVEVALKLFEDERQGNTCRLSEPEYSRLKRLRGEGKATAF
jgi:hypothetical protein